MPYEYEKTICNTTIYIHKVINIARIKPPPPTNYFTPINPINLCRHTYNFYLCLILIFKTYISFQKITFSNIQQAPNKKITDKFN